MPTSLLSTGTAQSLPRALVDEIARAVPTPHLALMVYGSQARGSAGVDSDVDVLALVERDAGAYIEGRVSVTSYTPAHLHSMASASSLFVLHLRTEGLILEDPEGILGRALAAYRPLRDFESLRNQIRAAATVLEVSEPLFQTHGQALSRLAIYLLRTALYLDSAEVGRPLFDLTTVSEAHGDDLVVRASSLKRADTYGPSDLRLLGRAIDVVLGAQARRTISSVEEIQRIAIDLSTSSPHASALLVNVLFGPGEVDYVGLALAPW